MIKNVKTSCLAFSSYQKIDRPPSFLRGVRFARLQISFPSR
jgi:hypothetical protein